jgi:hypothetical protein
VRLALLRRIAFLPALVFFALFACGIPLGAIRRSPPEGIDARVLAAQGAAPDFTLEGTTGRFHLADVVAGENVLLVFYRGHW